MILLASAVGWPDVALSLIAGLPGIVAAVGVILNRRMLQTPSGTSIGKQVEDSNHIAISTHHKVSALTKANGIREDTP